MLQELRYRAFCRRLQAKGLAVSKKQSIKPMDKPIDFVVTWVDGSDPTWCEQRDFYAKELGRASTADSGDPRFRDWDIFRYWFRAVEQYAPWVHNVYLVTCGHVPEWLKTDAPKLKVVKHTDFIPEEYLPTFSSITIELNLHRIKDLSEHFVYFNDDMFLNQSVIPEDFFSGRKAELHSYIRASFTQ